MKPMFEAREIALKNLVLHPANVRANAPGAYDEGQVAPLAANIRACGLLQPLLVATMPGAVEGQGAWGDAGFYVQPEPARDLGTEADPELAAWFGRMGVPITESDEAAAYYVPAEDRIHMPRIGTFESVGAFFGTLAHEMAHATKHPSRLDRRHEGITREENYSREEVVAELAAVMACARLGIPPAFDQSAAYLKHWVGVMREDKRAIVRAATMAQAAADWMLATAGEVRAHGLLEAA